MLSSRLQLSKFIIDLSSLLSSKLFVLLLDLLGAIFVARLLGPEKKGVVTVVLIIPTMFMSFADLGLRQSAIYFLGRRLYSDQEIISSIVFMVWVVSLVGIVITSILVCSVPGGRCALPRATVRQPVGRPD